MIPLNPFNLYKLQNKKDKCLAVLFSQMEPQKYLVNVNLTSMMEFVLLGFSDIPNLQMFLFVIFLFTYVITLMGNGTIILITGTDQTLQTPMHFFLGNLSFLEICCVSATLPRMLINLWTQKRHISLFAVQHR